ncbi:MAG: ribosome maturation factor RimP [Actinomycetota bacterium]
MALVDNLNELLAPVVKASGLLLEEIKVIPVGRSRIISVMVDHEERNLNLDEVAASSRVISEILENYSQLGDNPFTLEVTSPGVDRPLVKAYQWKKNLGRLISIVKVDGEKLIGRLKSLDFDSASLEVKSGKVSILFSDIKRATVEIKFNRIDGDKR